MYAVHSSSTRTHACIACRTSVSAAEASVLDPVLDVCRRQQDVCLRFCDYKSLVCMPHTSHTPHKDQKVETQARRQTLDWGGSRGGGPNLLTGGGGIAYRTMAIFLGNRLPYHGKSLIYA